MSPGEKIIGGFRFVKFKPTIYEEKEMASRSIEFYQWLDARRTVREFSTQPVSISIIENILKSASTAPSGAHKQPWSFCVVSNPSIKKAIREGAEKEEYENYHGRMSQEWVEDLGPFQTDWSKPFLEFAPHLIVIFKKAYDILPSGAKRNNYYVVESVGIACGLLLAAIHNAGLVALTHTPSPMNFLSKILSRPENERPFLLIPIGYPLEETFVPKLKRKPLEEISTFYE
jgi:iodotyrosine deiodinase